MPRSCRTRATLVGSGGYTLEGIDADAFTLKANPRYWAGEPAIGTVRMLTTLNGGSPVDAFVAGDVDVTGISYYDAAWIAYDKAIGPSLRSDPSLSVTYYGFETRQPPFDDARVREAFAMAVDWRRLAALDEPGSSVPATSLVPVGIPGHPGRRLPARVRPRRARARCSRRPATRRVPISVRSRSSPTVGATTAGWWRCSRRTLASTSSTR